ncbi:MAG: DUF779 domain-containing protein [Gammaproteobacteria bacterium]|nr:DUF779 domain-containing protein [Gammaproteobacteria bacterium]MDH3608587.1 DUF779 domain-containing protein [Gammaproteobacteria bacterium]NNC67876.1 DUF779 domain-containing protein [Gammaproteobacteria bacterium]
MVVERLSVTDKAKAIIDQLREKHGELMFHQSGGCCDGSSPMCFAKGDFLIGSRDLCLGEIHGCKFYMASDQFEYYQNMHINIDVTEGRGSSFSLEIPLGVRFMAVSRLLEDDEISNIRPVAS